MANQIPFAQSPPNAGGYVLPFDIGDILVNGILQEAGAPQLCGDARATGVYKTQFPIWLGLPTAGPVGEGAAKPATGAEFSQATMLVKKFASIVLFTDEMIEDVQSGDMNVLVDSGVRKAIAQSIDAHINGLQLGNQITGVFDSMLRGTTATVEYDQTKADGLPHALSAAMGILEGNGYGDQGSMGVELGFGFAQLLRDARSAADATRPVFGAGSWGGFDPTYGLATSVSTNLDNPQAAAGAGKIVGFVVHKPNLHLRIRKDVVLSTSSEATVNDGTTDRKLFQENLTAVRYETRLAFMVHDINRAVVAITNAT